MMLPTTDVPPASGRLTTVRPKGQSEYRASLNACSPNGIVTIRMHMITPAIA
jgi:hypothetical protein